MGGEARKLGVDVLGTVPWGAHLCYFYESKQDLIDVLVPYFQAGLENNEFCLWITSEPLSEKEAESAMAKAISDFPQYLASGQMEIIPHTEWYLKGGTFNREGVLYACLDKLQRALASGYDGMRISGDTAWLERVDWSKFIDYEEEVNAIIGKHRILALCTYPIHKYGGSEVIEVANRHQFNLIKNKGEFALIGGYEHEQVEEALRLADEKFSAAFRSSTDPMIIANFKDGRVIDINDSFTRIIGFSREEAIGRTTTEMGVWSHSEERARFVRMIQLQGEVRDFPIRFCNKAGEMREGRLSAQLIEYGTQPFTIGVATDITERKQVEENQHVIVETALDGFWLANLEGKFLEVNGSYCQMTGYTREELLNMSIHDIEAVENPEQTIQHIKKVVEHGSGRFETRHKRKDGRIIDVEVNVNYLNEGEGQLFVFLRDITGRKRTQEARGMLLESTAVRPMTPLQERFIREGFKEIGDREIIELLLSLVLSTQKAKQLAEASIERFKNLRDFLAASPMEMQEVGITPACMFCLKLLHELPIMVLQQRVVAQSIYKSSREVFDYLNYSMRDLKKEVFKVIYLDSRSQIIDAVDLFEGSVDSIPIRPREIVESAIKHHAAGLVFVHNHPTGDPTPSRTDKQLTRDLIFVGLILQIKVLDHIIIGEDSYFSFADDGLIQKYEDSFLNLKIRGVLASRVLYRCYNQLPKGLHHQH